MRKQVRKKKRVYKLDRPRTYCVKFGCMINDINKPPNMKFHHIKSLPPPLPENTRKSRYVQREGDVLLRKELLDRRGLSRSDKSKSYRICECHEFEEVPKWKHLHFKGKHWNQQYVLTVPKGAGPKSTMARQTDDSQGIGGDRFVRKYLEQLSTAIHTIPGVEVIENVGDTSGA